MVGRGVLEGWCGGEAVLAETHVTHSSVKERVDEPFKQKAQHVHRP